jgi:pimeloyl-ACP methyl ester carboxylesterase
MKSSSVLNPTTSTSGDSDDQTGSNVSDGTVNTIENLTRKQCLEKPVSACTADKPCVTDTGNITLPSDVPDCAQDNPAQTFNNADQVTRHFCFYNGSASDSKPRPLVIYLHGGAGNAYNMYGSSLLRTKAETFPLSPSVNGFHILSLQARNLNGNEIGLSPSTHHDAFWWDFRAPSTNPDMRDLDDIIASIVAKYAVDKTRIYLVGWSEGGMLSQLYGISRHKTPSIHGLKIAATAIYSAPSPFLWRSSPEEDYCSTDLDFTTQFPIQIISRSCDIPCNQEQQDFFGTDAIANHGTPIYLWKDILMNTLKNSNAEFSLIDDDGNPTTSCMPVGNGPNQCNQKHAFQNHVTWPKKAETKMLNFLKKFQSL